MDRAEEKAGPEDVGEQALMRGPFATEGLWAGRAHHTTRAVHSPLTTLRLSMCPELAIDRPNEGG
jgi:hypothetical protein